MYFFNDSVQGVLLKKKKNPIYSYVNNMLPVFRLT